MVYTHTCTHKHMHAHSGKQYLNKLQRTCWGRSKRVHGGKARPRQGRALSAKPPVGTFFWTAVGSPGWVLIRGVTRSYLCLITFEAIV